MKEIGIYFQCLIIMFKSDLYSLRFNTQKTKYTCSVHVSSISYSISALKLRNLIHILLKSILEPSFHDFTAMLKSNSDFTFSFY